MKNFKKQKKKIKKILKEYFKDRYLKILDTTKLSYRQGYSGVTFNYICKFVLEEKFTKEEVAAVLMQMLLKKQLKCLYCGGVEDMVFENADPGTGHWSFKFIKKEHRFNEKEHKYDYIKLESLIKLLETSYSTKFQINKNENTDS